MFTDYYAEASCTAGRANFITGEIPLRTGLTTVGQAGADVGLPDQACTLATALKAQGYATGQFGKNHLGDLNKYLPTVHGFDEFFGYLYHLDAMSDPYWYSYPVRTGVYNEHGPRSLVHCWATDADDATSHAALGQGRQAENRGRRPAAAVPGHVRRARTCTKCRSEGKVRHGRHSTCAGQVLLRVHGQGQEGWQAVLRLAQHHAHARLHVSCRRSTRRCRTPRQLRPGRGRHGANGRLHRRSPEARRRDRRGREHDRHLHAPTTAPRSSPGPTAA